MQRVLRRIRDRLLARPPTGARRRHDRGFEAGRIRRATSAVVEDLEARLCMTGTPTIDAVYPRSDEAVVVKVHFVRGSQNQVPVHVYVRSTDPDGHTVTDAESAFSGEYAFVLCPAAAGTPFQYQTMEEVYGEGQSSWSSNEEHDTIVFPSTYTSIDSSPGSKWVDAAWDNTPALDSLGNTLTGEQGPHGVELKYYNAGNLEDTITYTSDTGTDTYGSHYPGSETFHERNFYDNPFSDERIYSSSVTSPSTLLTPNNAAAPSATQTISGVTMQAPKVRVRLTRDGADVFSNTTFRLIRRFETATSTQESDFTNYTVASTIGSTTDHDDVKDATGNAGFKVDGSTTQYISKAHAPDSNGSQVYAVTDSDRGTSIVAQSTWYAKWLPSNDVEDEHLQIGSKFTIEDMAIHIYRDGTGMTGNGTYQFAADGTTISVGIPQPVDVHSGIISPWKLTGKTSSTTTGVFSVRVTDSTDGVTSPNIDDMTTQTLGNAGASNVIFNGMNVDGSGVVGASISWDASTTYGTNESYDVYRRASTGSGQGDLIGTTSNVYFLDTTVDDGSWVYTVVAKAPVTGGTIAYGPDATVNASITAVGVTGATVASSNSFYLYFNQDIVNIGDTTNFVIAADTVNGWEYAMGVGADGSNDLSVQFASDLLAYGNWTLYSSDGVAFASGILHPQDGGYS